MSENSNNEKILDDLIQKGNLFIDEIIYVPPRSGQIRSFKVYTTKNPKEYQDWVSLSQRFIKLNYAEDLEEFVSLTKNISPTNHKGMLGILNAIRLMPESLKVNDKSNTGIHIINNNNLSQNQTQEIAINIFVESIKDELTGKQQKELREILQEFQKEPEQAKPKLLEKIQSFGNNVLASIVANIATNPNILNNF